MNQVVIGTVFLAQSFVLLQLAWSLSMTMETFEENRCAVSSDNYTRFGIIYWDCIHTCKTIAECSAISYMKLQFKCTHHFGDESVTECPYHVYSKKSEWKHNNNMCMCPDRKRCNLNMKCVNSECPRLTSPDDGALYGNMLGTGAKVVFKCRPGYILDVAGRLVCEDSGSWNGNAPACVPDPACEKRLVTGPNGVADDQLSASSYWCQGREFCSRYRYTNTAGGAARFARLHSVGWVTGAWIARYNNQQQHIQVDFKAMRVVSGVVLQARDHYGYTVSQYVKAFKLQISADCTTFETIADQNGNDRTFVGNDGVDLDDTVTRYLDKRILARCVRINPTVWNIHISLRFDILGCRVKELLD